MLLLHIVAVDNVRQPVPIETQVTELLDQFAVFVIVRVPAEGCFDADMRSLAVYAALFCVCMLVVFRVLAWPWMLLIILAVLLIYERKILKEADFMLLLTFICFFIFAGNLTRIDAVRSFLDTVLTGRELLAGTALSQGISNVPAALLLSGFTGNGRALLLGVDIGGLGTPIASLASLISLKLYMHAEDADAKTFLAKFMLFNIVFLAVLLPLGLLIA